MDKARATIRIRGPFFSSSVCPLFFSFSFFAKLYTLFSMCVCERECAWSITDCSAFGRLNFYPVLSHPLAVCLFVYYIFSLSFVGKAYSTQSNSWRKYSSIYIMGMTSFVCIPYQSVDCFFFVCGRGKTRSTGWRVWGRQGIGLFHNRISGVLLALLQLLYMIIYTMVCMPVCCFSIQFHFTPFFGRCRKKFTRQSLLILMCAWKAHFLNVKGTPRWGRRSAITALSTARPFPPPSSAQSKLFAEFIVYKMRARLLYV